MVVKLSLRLTLNHAAPGPTAVAPVRNRVGIDDATQYHTKPSFDQIRAKTKKKVVHCMKSLSFVAGWLRYTPLVSRKIKVKTQRVSIRLKTNNDGRSN